MPTLKQLSCHVERGSSNTPLREYNTVYGDGVVSTYIGIPSKPTTFSVHTTSDGFIAGGLAMFVFIDGIAQCNRNRRDLQEPGPGVEAKDTAINFRVRQKETKSGDGEFIAHQWTFKKLDVAAADKTTPMEESRRHSVGSIEVVILRCQRSPAQPQPSSINTSTMPKENSQPQSPPPKARSEPSDKASSVGGLSGLFDGANDGWGNDNNNTGGGGGGGDNSWGNGANDASGDNVSSQWNNAPQPAFEKVGSDIYMPGQWPSEEEPAQADNWGNSGNQDPGGDNNDTWGDDQGGGWGDNNDTSKEQQSGGDAWASSDNKDTSSGDQGGGWGDSNDSSKYQQSGDGAWASSDNNQGGGWGDNNGTSKNQQSNGDDWESSGNQNTWGGNNDDSKGKQSNVDAWGSSNKKNTGGGDAWASSNNNNTGGGAENTWNDSGGNEWNVPAQVHDAKPTNGDTWASNDPKDGGRGVPGAWVNDTDNKQGRKSSGDNRASANTTSNKGAGKNHSGRRSTVKPSSKPASVKQLSAYTRPRHSSAAKPPSDIDPSKPYTKSYWSNWQSDMRSTTSNKAPEAGKATETKAKEASHSRALTYPSPPRQTTTPSVVASARLSHQVQASRGAIYYHTVSRPTYTDSMERPYAVFVFKYRSNEMLGEILGEELQEIEYDRGSYRERMMKCKKEDLMEELMRMKSALGYESDESLDTELNAPKGSSSNVSAAKSSASGKGNTGANKPPQNEGWGGGGGW